MSLCLPDSQLNKIWVHEAARVEAELSRRIHSVALDHSLEPVASQPVRVSRGGGIRETSESPCNHMRTEAAERKARAAFVARSPNFGSHPGFFSVDLRAAGISLYFDAQSRSRSACRRQDDCLRGSRGGCKGLAQTGVAGVRASRRPAWRV